MKPETAAPLAFITESLSHWAPWQEAVTQTRAELSDIKAKTAMRPALFAALATGRRLLLVTATSTRAASLAAQIADFTASPVNLLSPSGFLRFEGIHQPAAQAGKRCESVYRYSRCVTGIMVAPISAIMQKTWPGFASWCEPLVVSRGKDIDIHAFLERLVEMGYRPVDVVEAPGQFARRGGLIDVFPAQSESPMRMEFFGDAIESLRGFSPSDQLSRQKLETVSIFPAGEFRQSNALLKQAESFPQVFVDEHASAASEFLQAERLVTKLLGAAEIIKELGLPSIVVDEPKEVQDEAARYWERAGAAFADVAWSSSIGLSDYYLSPEEIQQTLADAPGVGDFGLRPGRLELVSLSPPPLPRDAEALAEEVKPKLASGWRVVVVVASGDHRERLIELLRQARVGDRSLLTLAEAHTEQGFTFPEARLALYGLTESGLRYVRQPQLVGPGRQAALVEFRGLQPGDLLVHELYGIASFGGLVSRAVADVKREYLLLEFAAGDKLYLPTEQLGKVTRYIGPQGDKTKITRLGSGDWLRSHRKTSKAVKRLAMDLLSLYAERLKMPGYAYPPDGEWQKEMELGFPFQETEGQINAIRDVKTDLESAFPMDRLICGDVGYGKTEVALRATFKVVTEGKQVLLLAPTTVLAEQHYRAFSERLAAYPITVALLSRFVPAKRATAIAKDALSGKVDVLIGTHRVLRKGLRLPDLGLVIIDEEQRFGVGQKEKLREAHRKADILTLSATPIPRTLQMSMSGIRDLTVIDTPPQGRLPVLTYVGEYNESLLREAVGRELARGGQLFYLHNNVSSLPAAVRRAAKLAPGATIAAAHGQMTGRELEKAMLSFYHGEIQILICTTIIESGLDIPNANTLIVENADHLGLAQMYQIRGRVGRGKRQAFAYFTYPAKRQLTETAFERLQTVAEFTELGSGLKIAMRDLEIRGAGDLLGAEQHGHMAAVGFDLYCRMLREAVEELQGRPAKPESLTQLELPVAAYLPADYIEDEDVRLELYRDIAAADGDRLNDIETELRDRFGAAPPEVSNLIIAARLRLLALRAGITKISVKGDLVSLGGLKEMPSRLEAAYAGVRETKFHSDTGQLRLRLAKPPVELLDFLDKLLSAIIPAVTTEPKEKSF